MAEPIDLIERYVNGELSDAELQELAQWLRDDEGNRRRFLAEIDFYRNVRGVLLEQQRDLAMRDEAGDEGEGSGTFTAEVLAALRQIQASAQDAPLLNADLVLARYKAEHQPTPKPASAWKLIPMRFMFGAVAAVLLIGVALIWVIFGGTGNPAAPGRTLVQQPPEALETPVAQARPVAHLTATHEAVWTGGPATAGPRVGDTLHAGTRLTLTAGFAQITTASGAIAILQAPATIQLTDSNNAIRLHAGRLVGICETDASKGFLVHTPHMDVTDLGTRFGVDSSNQTTRVQVIQGEVEVASTLGVTDDPPAHLVAGQAAVVDPRVDPGLRIEPATDRFAHDWQAIVLAPKLTGAIRYEHAIPSDLRVGAIEADDVRLFHERSGVVLDRGVQANVLDAGRYTGDDLFKSKALTNVTVDSYFVHFDSDSAADVIAHRTVTLRFDRPILGVITASAQLAASHADLGVPGVAYGNQSDWAVVDPFVKRDGSGLDVSRNQASIGQDDAIQLSDDRQTLTLDLFIIDAIDQVRVLVQSESQDQ